MPTIIAIDPFNRLEGDLRVELIVEDNTVIEAKSSGILFRGFERWKDAKAHQESDLGFFLTASFRAGLDRIGRGPCRYLSYGAYDEPLGGGNWLPAGFHDGFTKPFDQELIGEHIAASFFRDAVEARHPSAGVTNPFADKKGAYSWSKAPRYNGKTVEVGPLARLIIAGDPLICDMVEKLGASSLVRMLARLQEMIKLVRQLTLWLERINPNEPFYSGNSSRYSETGVGLIEAARGGLGHWVRISSSFITNYQVITPSAWNMSPRDDAGHPGPVEEALSGLALGDQNNPVEVNHVIRSFDPCMSCTVH